MVSYTDLDNLFNSDEDELTVSDVQEPRQLLDKKAARNKSVFLWFWVGGFFACVGEVAKQVYEQVLGLLCGRRAVLVESYSRSLDTNRLLILYPHSPDSISFLNIPSAVIVQVP